MDALALFRERIPAKPYCTNDPARGLRVLPADIATRYRHIQPNGPMMCGWLVFDLDFAGAAFAWDDNGLPVPTITAINPANSHAHLFYGLESPVALSDAAHDAPIRYAAAVQAAFRSKLGADPGYAGLIAKNPLCPDWKVIPVGKIYELGELAEYVHLPKSRPSAQQTGLGRNCTLFDELRAWAYRNVLVEKRNGADFAYWLAVTTAQASRLNSFSVPLAGDEMHSIAKSVAKWTWSNFTDARLSEIQSARGKLGGRPRSTTLDGEPWKKLGISRSSYYRHKATQDDI